MELVSYCTLHSYVGIVDTQWWRRTIIIEGQQVEEHVYANVNSWNSIITCITCELCV